MYYLNKYHSLISCGTIMSHNFCGCALGAFLGTYVPSTQSVAPSMMLRMVVPNGTTQSIIRHNHAQYPKSWGSILGANAPSMRGCFADFAEWQNPIPKVVVQYYGSHTGGVCPQVIRKIVQLKTKHLNNQDALQNQENLSKINPTKILESTFKNSDYSRNAIQNVKIESSTKSHRQLQDKTASDAINIAGTSTVRKASASKLNVFFNKSYNKHTHQYFAINNQSMDLQATSRPKVATSVAWVFSNAKPIGKHVAHNSIKTFGKPRILGKSCGTQLLSSTKGFMQSMIDPTTTDNGVISRTLQKLGYASHTGQKLCTLIKDKTKGFSSFFGIKKNNLSTKSWMLKNKEKTMADLTFSKMKNNLNKESLYKSFNNPNTRYSKMMEISLITISLASANRIRQWAEKTLPNGKVVGEVINPETVHYKTLKPIKGGLFCERIFGPLKDYECACGKKFNIKQYLTKDVTVIPNTKTLEKRYFCRACDVEYTYSLIRRTQLGYIALATPTTHVWFVKGLPSYISILLDMKKTHLQNVIYNTRTLTLEHAFRGPRNMPTSPSVIYETWQKIMQAQYPDKYGQPKENLLKTDLKKQGGNSSPLVLKKQKTQPDGSRKSPTQNLNKVGLAGTTKKQANHNRYYNLDGLVSSESNNKKKAVFNMRSNKLTPQEINKINIYYLVTRYAAPRQYATQSKQKDLILLDPKQTKQVYKENKKKYSRGLNLYNQYDNKRFKKTSLIKVYSFLSVKSSYILQPEFATQTQYAECSSTPGKEQDALPKDQTQNMYTYSSFLTSPVINGLLFNKVLASYHNFWYYYASHKDFCITTFAEQKLWDDALHGCAEWHNPKHKRLQKIHILPWWTKFVNNLGASAPSMMPCMVVPNGTTQSIIDTPSLCFDKLQKQKDIVIIQDPLDTKEPTALSSKIGGHFINQNQNNLLISNFFNTSLYKFWEFFGKVNQKTIYSVFGHDWFEFKGNKIKTRKLSLTNSAKTQALFGFLDKLLIYTSQPGLVGFRHKKGIYSTNVIMSHNFWDAAPHPKSWGGILWAADSHYAPKLKQDNNNLIQSRDLLLTKLNNFEKPGQELSCFAYWGRMPPGTTTFAQHAKHDTTKLAIMLLLNIKNKITTNKTKTDNQITNTTFAVVKCNSLLRSMVWSWFGQKEEFSDISENSPKPKHVGALRLVKSKNNIKPPGGHALRTGDVCPQECPQNTTTKVGGITKIKLFSTFTHIVKGKFVQRLFTFYQTSKNQKHIVSFAYSTIYYALPGGIRPQYDALHGCAEWHNPKHNKDFFPQRLKAMLGFDTRHFPRKGLSNKTQALQTSKYFTLKILTQYFFFLKPPFKNITSTIYNSLLNDTIKIQKRFHALGCAIGHNHAKHHAGVKPQDSLFKHQKLAISQLDIACQFPVQNIVLTYFFRLKASFDFMNNAKHSFDINFRIKKLDTKYLIMGSTHNHAKLDSSDLGAYAPSMMPCMVVPNHASHTGGHALRTGDGCPQECPQGTTRSIIASVSLSLQLNNKPLLVNNIYCLSHRELWEQEKDWQDFAYYYYPSNWLVENILKSSKNQISIETFAGQKSSGRLVSPSKILPDLFIPFYKHRNYEILFKFDNSFTYTDRNYFTENFQNYSLGMNINTAFSGAGLIQKLLNDFDFSELKKLDKQNRVLLFEYNKYIKNLKTKLALEMKAPPRKKSKLKQKSNKNLKNNLKQVYYKACQIRDTLIRRTKLTRKIFNFIEDTTFSNKKLGSVGYYSGNQTLRTSKWTKDSDIVTGSAHYASHQTQLVKHGTEKEPITNGLNMILTLLPVLPPVLRPVLKMSGQFTVSDLNRLYQRIIYRNERLKKFLQDPALNSSFEMKYAQRLVQEAVDNLIQNGKSGVVPEKDTRGRLLKSLSDILKGKQGRFRQYLLGKRVDYSGRSVIVVGPRLKLHECGIPKEMALVLYSPFLIKRILNEKIADTYLAAKKIIKTNPLLVSQLLREIMKSCPVLLNRAPTLHRLGFQAFQPKLVDGKAILLHPLVCPAFNADFDGDQMAVHVPITFEARAEAWKLMLARNNLLSPATGDPLILPSQDMVLGCYYLTFLGVCHSAHPAKHPTQASFNLSISSKKGSGLFFHNINSVLKAYNQQLLQTHSIIWVNIQADIENGNIFEQPLEIRLPLAQYKLPNTTFALQKLCYAEHNKKQLLINSTTQTSKNPYYNLNYIEIYSRSHNFLTIKGTLRNQIIRTTPGKILFNMLIKKALEKKASLTV